ncbi:MAG: tetratricopeptide repeat protein [Planctomycetes bacterium]|nr:tetratricopeptide repeat protein [Planctomycetota bacterium]
MESLTPRQRGLVAAILLAGVLLRVHLVLSLVDHPFFQEPLGDAGAYDRWAREIAEVDFWGKKAFWLDPLYPYALALLYKVAGHRLLVARFVQVAVGAAGSLLLFETGRRLAGFRVGLVALALSVACKTLAFHDACPLKEGLAVALGEAAFFALVTAEDRRFRLLLAGFAIGLCGLLRGNYLIFLPCAAAWTRSWRRALWVLAGGVCAVLPVTIRNTVVEDFVPTTYLLGANLYVGNNPDNTTGRYKPPPFLLRGTAVYEEKGFREEAERRLGRPLRPSEIDRYWRGEAVRYVLAHPLTFAETCAKRLLLLVNRYDLADEYDVYFFEAFSPVLAWLLPVGLLFPFACLGLALGWRRFPLLTVFAASYGASVLPFFMFARYRLPAFPAVFFFAALGLVEAERLARGKPGRELLRATLVLATSFAVVHAPIEAWLDVGHFDTATSHMNYANALLRRGDPTGAARAFEEAMRIRPAMAERASVLYGAGVAQGRSGNLPRAELLLRAAAAREPKDPYPWLDLGLLLLGQGDAKRAAAAFAAGLERAPEERRAHLLLGRALAADHRAEEALRVWREAGARFADAPEFPSACMKLLAGLPGREAEAQAAAREVLRREPRNLEARGLAEPTEGREHDGR